MNTETPPPITNIERPAKSGGLERTGAIAVAVAFVGLVVFGVASAPGPAAKPEPKVPAIEIGGAYRLGYSERLHLGVTVPKNVAALDRMFQLSRVGVTTPDDLMTATEACFTGPNTPALVTDIVQNSPERYAVLVMDGPDKGCEGVVPRGWLQEKVKVR
jgi:hypothetical protein